LSGRGCQRSAVAGCSPVSTSTTRAAYWTLWMVLPDVNVLVYAQRRDAAEHERYRAWLEETINSDEPYGLADAVLSGFLRIVTHPRIFARPDSIDETFASAVVLRTTPDSGLTPPGPGPWA